MEAPVEIVYTTKPHLKRRGPLWVCMSLLPKHVSRVGYGVTFDHAYENWQWCVDPTGGRAKLEFVDPSEAL